MIHKDEMFEICGAQFNEEATIKLHEDRKFEAEDGAKVGKHQ